MELIITTPFTLAERAIAELISEGWTNAYIAKKRNVDPRTVERQVACIYEKMAVPKGKNPRVYLAYCILSNQV
jgi:DNA-binding NarL/FixJ family response regulator